MNESFSQFFQALRNTDIGTKLVVAVTAVALVGAVAIFGMLSKDPHFEVVFNNLDDAELVAVSKALADGGVEFRVLQGDGTSAVTTRGEDVLKAQQLAYSADAISHVTKGILSSAGTAGIFAGMEERNQLVREKEMSEIEKIIEVLDFVAQAEVFLPKEASNSLRGPVKNTVSMVIRTTNGLPVTAEQGDNLARTLANFMEVGLDKVVITDHKGRMVHGGTAEDGGLIDGRFLEIQQEFNNREEQRVNMALAQLFGPNKARVTITSEFDFTQKTLQSRTANGKPIDLNSRSYETKTPVGASAAGANGGGVAGSSSNVAANGSSFGSGAPASVTGANGLVEQMSTTTEKENQSFVGTTDMVEIINQPTLKRLSVSLALDESLAGQADMITNNVKSMVGFDETRKDSFGDPLVLAMYAPEAETGAEGEEGAPAEEALPEESAFSLDMLLENGVELVSALAFIFLLLKGLKGAKGAAQEETVTVGGQPVAAGGGSNRVEIDPESLARAQVEDLVQNNPERVAQILSNWVVEDRSPVKNS